MPQLPKFLIKSPYKKAFIQKTIIKNEFRYRNDSRNHRRVYSGAISFHLASNRLLNPKSLKRNLDPKEAPPTIHHPSTEIPESIIPLTFSEIRLVMRVEQSLDGKINRQLYSGGENRFSGMSDFGVKKSRAQHSDADYSDERVLQAENV